MNVFKLHLCVFISINAFCQVIAETQEVVLPPEQEETEYWKQEIQRLLENWPSNSNCEKCGKSSVDVYGRLKRTEEVIPLFKYPWIVAFLRNGEIICSGTLISQNFVLTVADCIFKPESANDKKCQRTFIPQNCFYTPQELSMIFVGDKFLEKSVKIKRFKPHDRYNYWKKMNNLALIELEEPLKCSPTTSPICLPFNMKELKFDNKLSIAGWGSNAFAGYSSKYLDQFLV
ncbi:peptidase S1 domain-containing protein [Trichonephila clavata]|uniref:Peptidase S1 domain-containing protein n=1 Tax=Trichonephila clavata TaxID=2740835 RepID=A0A8X6KEP9_TRICU|nr:peptidase S1 domain-containing protein [Trichonephila clavata]